MIDEEPPRIFNAPEQIWLCAGDIDFDVEFSDCDEIGWATDTHYPSDVPYMRADLAADMNFNLHRENERLKRILSSAIQLVSAPSWAGISDEDINLERALRECGYLTRP